MGHELTCRLSDPGGTFWARVGGMDRARPARDNNGPAKMLEREDRARGGAARGGNVQFGDSVALRLGPLHWGLRFKFRRVFLPCLADDLCLPIPAPGIVALGTAVDALCRSDPHGLLGLYCVMM